MKDTFFIRLGQSRINNKYILGFVAQSTLQLNLNNKFKVDNWQKLLNLPQMFIV